MMTPAQRIAHCRGRVSASVGCDLLPPDLRAEDIPAWRAGYAAEAREPRVVQELALYARIVTRRVKGWEG